MEIERERRTEDEAVSEEEKPCKREESSREEGISLKNSRLHLRSAVEATATQHPKIFGSRR